ncbi:hypothetical protein ZWY2020_012599 [Hordeum vulgare]|nr:hypothetical protein ZWY2020_012599 [Hordeum vulgare]
MDRAFTSASEASTLSPAHSSFSSAHCLCGTEWRARPCCWFFGGGDRQGRLLVVAREGSELRDTVRRQQWQPQTPVGSSLS